MTIYEVVSFEHASLLSKTLRSPSGLLTRQCHSCRGWLWDELVLMELDVVQCGLCKEFNSA